jgi:hypothetical protein
VAFHGTVVSGEKGSFALEDAPNPEARPTVVGARVRLTTTFEDKEKDCGEGPSWQTFWNTAEQDHQIYVARTDGDGSFSVRVFLAGLLGFDQYVILCVDKIGYEPFVYKVIHFKSHTPEHGEKQMNIVLKPMAAAGSGNNK